MKLIDNDKLIKSMNIVEVPYRPICYSIYYEDYIDRLLIATDASEFKQIREIAYAHSADDRTLSTITKTITKSVRYYIDNNEVDENTFEDVIKKIELRMYDTTKERCVWETVNETNGTTIWRIKEKNPTIGWKIVDPQLPKDVIKHTLAEYAKSFRKSEYDNESAAEAIRFMLKEHLNIIDEKENEDMVNYEKIKNDIFEEYSRAVAGRFMMCPQIVNYKYNETTGETTVYWDDKTQTIVKADNLSEANQFEGFCAACAKKLFGNKSTYLNQFDKWTVKIPERERLAAEKKAAEDKAREEAKARRAAKKAERKRKRDIEIRAKQLADMYYSQEIEDEANKIANEKYGVPTDWLNN